MRTLRMVFLSRCQDGKLFGKCSAMKAEGRPAFAPPSLFSRDSLACLVGMTLFFTYFRYQAVFGYIFPANMTVRVVDGDLNVYPLFLMTLLLASLVAMFTAKRLAVFLAQHHLWIVFCTALGSLGMFCCILHRSGVADSAVLLLAIPLVAIGFLAGLLAWATYCCAGFGFVQLIILAAAYLFSLLTFTVIGEFFVVLKDYVLIMLPLGTGIMWLLVARQGYSIVGEPGTIVRVVKGYVILYAAFLLVGSIIRGIVDLEYPTSGLMMLRWMLSLAVSLAVLLLCLYVCYRAGAVLKSVEGAGRSESRSAGQSIEDVVLKLLIAMAALFLAGTFACLIANSFALGGHLVVVARSTMDMLLWIALCNLAFMKRAAPIPLFLVCVVFVEGISWLLSYALVPSVSFLSGTDARVYETLVLAAMSPLVIGIAVWAGVVSLRKNKRSDSVAASTENEADAPVVSQALAERGVLTKREIEVVGMVAKGYTLSLVAEKLFISRNTAQSHIKSIYRKLGIHSKNELIEMLSASLQAEPK